MALRVRMPAEAHESDSPPLPASRDPFEDLPEGRPRPRPLPVSRDPYEDLPEGRLRPIALYDDAPESRAQYASLADMHRAPLELIPIPEETNNDLAKKSLFWTKYGAIGSISAALISLPSLILIVVPKEELLRWLSIISLIMLKAIGIIINILIFLAPWIIAGATVVFLIVIVVNVVESMSTTQKIICVASVSLLLFYLLSQASRPVYLTKWPNPVAPKPTTISITEVRVPQRP